MNNNDLDIFGGVTPFQTNEPKINESNLENNTIFNTSEVEVINIPEVTEEKIEIESDSYNEMPFAGVNQQVNMEEKKEDVITQNIIEEKIEVNSNMQPVEKAIDENSGLKFLLVLGLIFLVFIILLPFIA